MLQRVPENHPNYAGSRVLLGHGFYELHDVGRCAATLENHLTGERVRNSNIEYFYMLALACEQCGELEKSRRLLLKVQSANVNFRDVGARLSNIESPLSHMQERGGPVLHEALTGSTAFTGGNIMERQATGMPPVPSETVTTSPPNSTRWS